jgi:type II secretory pathway component PulJ
VVLQAGIAPAPIPVAIRAAALAQVDADLQAAGLIDQNGAVTAQAQQDLGWEHTLRLPTPGVLVKGCLDDCTACEPARQKEIELELARKELENQLLKRKIELLDQAQEYRCCPDGDQTTQAATPAG